MKKIILPVIALSAIMMTSCGSGETEVDEQAAVAEMETAMEETEAMDEEINAIDDEEAETEALFEDLNN